MKTNPFPYSLIDSYLALLQNLSQANKLELIARLSQSMIRESSPKMSIKSLFGAFESEKSAENIIAEIREARTFKREITEF